MKILPTFISGVAVVETEMLVDQRGAFSRFFCETELDPVLAGREIVQINYSISHVPGTVRGMHYQSVPFAEMKLVRCLKGKVWDVALDIRAGSPTFLQWHAEELTPENAKMLIIPEGCAHGFQTLEPDTELLYLHTAFYQPEFERGINYNDPKINILWPVAVSEVSQRDNSHPALTEEFPGIEI